LAPGAAAILRRISIIAAWTRVGALGLSGIQASLRNQYGLANLYQTVLADRIKLLLAWRAGIPEGDRAFDPATRPEFPKADTVKDGVPP